MKEVNTSYLEIQIEVTSHWYGKMCKICGNDSNVNKKPDQEPNIHSLVTLLSTPVKYNAIQHNSSATSSTFTEIMTFSLDEQRQRGINLTICLLLKLWFAVCKGRICGTAAVLDCIRLHTCT